MDNCNPMLSQHCDIVQNLCSSVNIENILWAGTISNRLISLVLLRNRIGYVVKGNRIYSVMRDDVSNMLLDKDPLSMV